MANSDLTTDDGDTGAAVLSHGFSQIARALFAAGGTDDTLNRVLALAVATVEGCDFAEVFLIDGEAASTPLYTDPLVADLDALQRGLGEGPCLDAVSENLTYYAADLSDDDRWPTFGPAAGGPDTRHSFYRW